MPQRLSRTTVNFTPSLRPGLSSSIIESSVRSRSVADPDNEQAHFSMFGRRFVRHFTSGRRRDAFRPIAVVPFCITSVRLRTLAEHSNWYSPNLEPSVVHGPESVSRSHSKGNTSRLLDGRRRKHESTSEILLGEAATLTASVLPDDTRLCFRVCERGAGMVAAATSVLSI